MKRGPEPGTRSDARSFIDKAGQAWGMPCPEWVLALAGLAQSKGLKSAGEAIGYSGSAVSMVLSARYEGDMDKVRQKVMGALMGETVDCPGLGRPMSRNVCLDWQDKPFSPTSSLRARMYRACRDCPHFHKGGGDGQ